MAKAIIKLVTAEDEFTADQKQIMRRILNVLIDHDISVRLSIKVKKAIQLPVKLKKAV